MFSNIFKSERNAIRRFLYRITAAAKWLTVRKIVREINASGEITDEQAERLSSKVRQLELNGLTSITDKQAESLSK